MLDPLASQDTVVKTVQSQPAHNSESQSRTFRIICADVLAGLAQLPDNSINCCVTSPPYFGLRDYGVPGQIGLEATYPEYIARLVEVFREVRRVLRADGTLWLNLGDSYATGAGKVGECPGGGEQGERFKQAWGYRGGHTDSPKHAHKQVPDGKNPNANIPTFQSNRMPQPGLKPKDLMMIPARVAIALQDEGWWLRSKIVWAKPAPMPESVQDRCTRSHEEIFMLAKAERYFYDAQAIAEPLMRPEECERLTPARFGGADKFKEAKKQSRLHSGNEYRGTPTGTRNKRDVWVIHTSGYAGAHFATMPEELAETCVLAGCPEGGTVLDPFGGSGTTAVVALRHNRNAVLIELNTNYVNMARRRIVQDAPLFNEEVTVEA